MTGWRIGFSACPEWLADACDISCKVRLPVVANTVAQRASIVGLETDPKDYYYMVESFEKRRNLVYELLKSAWFQSKFTKSGFISSQIFLIIWKNS